MQCKQIFRSKGTQSVREGSAVTPMYKNYVLRLSKTDDAVVDLTTDLRNFSWSHEVNINTIFSRYKGHWI